MTTNDVLTLSVCNADHRARPSSLSVTLTLSRGAWQVPTDPSKPQVLVTSVPGATCADALAVTPTDLEPVFVYAQVGGYTERACIQMVAPAPRLSLTSTPVVLASGSTSLTISATAAGVTDYAIPMATSVHFSAEVSPSTIFALQPTDTFLNAMGVATATLVAPGAVQTVTVHATAQVPAPTPCPDEAAGVAPDAGTADLMVPRLPVDAGTRD